MIETRFMWFMHLERVYVNVVARRVDKMIESQITRGKGNPKETIKKLFKDQ